MANTYELIATTTIGAGGSSSVVLSAIPSTYTDIQVLISARVTRASTGSTLVVVFNSITSGYSDKTLLGDGSSASSSSSSGADIRDFIVPGANATASTFSNISIYIPNYASANYKSVSIDSVMENNGTTSYSNLTAGLMSNTAAISSMTFTEPNGGSNIAQYSTFSIYGIKNS